MVYSAEALSLFSKLSTANLIFDPINSYHQYYPIIVYQFVPRILCILLKCAKQVCSYIYISRLFANKANLREMSSMARVHFDYCHVCEITNVLFISIAIWSIGIDNKIFTCISPYLSTIEWTHPGSYPFLFDMIWGVYSRSHTYVQQGTQ